MIGIICAGDSEMAPFFEKNCAEASAITKDVTLEFIQSSLQF